MRAPSQAIARVVTSAAARDIFATWTEGPVRYRIGWAEGRAPASRHVGHRARHRRARPEFVNDPTASTWEIVVAQDGDLVEVAIAPRALEDPRFVWRRGRRSRRVAPRPIAAALARVAGPREDDIVWDPFVGSGAELVERALLGPHRALFGSDSIARAIAVARVNLARRRVRGSPRAARRPHPAPPGVTLIITNPPMGRRAARNVGTGDTLDRFVAHAAEALTTRGRLVWMAPWPKRARAAGVRAGLPSTGRGRST